MKLLVVAAWEPELARFRARSESAAPGPLEIVLETLGVGLVEAAVQMTRCIVRHRPSAALLLGTCGAFAASGAAAGATPVTGEVVAGARARLVDASVVDGAAALPGPMPVEAMFDGAVHDALVAAGARSVQIANTVGITVDDALAARLARSGGGDVEHLEAFAFARACAAEGLPCGAVLGVANMVGAGGRAEWLANHVSASDAAADVAFEALAAIAAIAVGVAAVRSSTRTP